MGIWISVGGRYENKDNKGISHFLEHILFKGSNRYNIKEIKELIEGKGGSLNAFTADEVTCYLCKVRPQNLSLSLDILSDMVLNPTIPTHEVEKERLVILEEIKMYKDLPQHHVHELLDALLWPNHTLGVNLAGTFKSVSGISRSDLLAYQKQNYHPNNIVVSIAGALDRDEIIAKIKDTFSGISYKESSSFAAANKHSKGAELTCLSKETEQTHLAMGLPSLKRKHRDHYALELLNIILGANMSSRLFNKVREERGLCYSIHSQVKALDDTGGFFVNVGTDNKKVKEALEVIIEELNIIKTKLVSEDEFSRAKEFFLGQLAMSLESTLNNMLWIGDSVITEGRTHTLKEITKKVMAVTREDLKRVAQKIFELNKLKVALIGPLKEEEQKTLRDLIQ